MRGAEVSTSWTDEVNKPRELSSIDLYHIGGSPVSFFVCEQARVSTPISYERGPILQQATVDELLDEYDYLPNIFLDTRPGVVKSRWAHHFTPTKEERHLLDRLDGIASKLSASVDISYNPIKEKLQQVSIRKCYNSGRRLRVFRNVSVTVELGVNYVEAINRAVCNQLVDAYLKLRENMRASWPNWTVTSES